MANIQKYFQQFGEAIKLRRYQENAILVEKRDRVISTLNDGIEHLRKGGRKIPVYRTFNQGSYDIGVGTKPLDGDYDIDVGVAFDLAHADHGPVDVKSWIFDSVEGHTKRVEMRTSCVTVFYQAAGEPVYHVDLAVYTDRAKNGGKLYLARGKVNSLPDNCLWIPSDPEGLTDLISGKYSGEEARQFRRIIRYLKRWKDHRFPASGHAAPRGIALAVAAYYWFSPATRFIDGEAQPDDLQAIRNLVGTMLRGFGTRLIITCPADPFDDLCARMSDLQMVEFKTKLETLLAALREAADDTDPNTACKALAKEFGPDFPIPEPEEIAKPQRRAITSSGSSA